MAPTLISAPLNFPYTAVGLTAAVNVMPNVYGLLNALDVFPARGLTSNVVQVRREEHTLAVLPAEERGGPASVAARKRGDVLFLPIPHFPHLDTILPEDLQNLLVTDGMSARPATLNDAMNRRLLAIRNKHAITREWVRMGALKGLIVDGYNREIINLFDAFDIAQKTIGFDLANADSDIDGACAQIVEHVQTNLRGETMTRVRIILSSSLFTKFIRHKNVQKYWLNWNGAEMMAHMRRADMGAQFGRVFVFQNIEFVEYYGVAPLLDGPGGAPLSAPFVEADAGYAYPVGTMDAFATYDAPANDIRFVNQPGQEVYISPEALEHGKGVELMTESNPLAVCRRPATLVKVVAGPTP